MWCIRKAGIGSQNTCFSSSMCAVVPPPLGIPERLLKMSRGRWHRAWEEEAFLCAMLQGLGCREWKRSVAPNSSKSPFCFKGRMG